jgi:hypothetical protein
MEYQAKIGPEVLRDPNKAIPYAYALGEKIAHSFHEEYPACERSMSPEAQRHLQPLYLHRLREAQPHLTGAAIFNWLLHSSIETLKGIAKECEEPGAGQLADSLHTTHLKDCAEARTAISNKTGVQTNASVDPFEEFDALRTEIWPVTVRATEGHVIASIQEESNIQDREASSQRPRGLMRAGMMVFSTELNFQNPYELLPEGY